MERWIVLLCLILVNGFFALAEIAFVASRRQKLEKWVAEGRMQARMVLDLLDRPQYFLSSIQVGITLIAIFSGVYGGYVFVGDFRQLLLDWGVPPHYAGQLALIGTIGGITYFSVVFGELVPKSLALHHAEAIAMRTVPVIRVFALVFSPVVWLLTSSTKGAQRLLGIPSAPHGSTVSEEELQYLLKSAGKLGVLEVEESRVFQNLFTFTDQVAQSLMTPAGRIRWIHADWETDRVKAFIRENQGSKFPVAHGKLDQLEGVLYARDFLEALHSGQPTLASLLHKPLFLAPNMPAFQILAKFREHKEYVGFVLDEYGHVQGMVTLRDLVEAIIGDLPTGAGEDTPDIIQRADGTYLVDAAFTVLELNRFFDRQVIPLDPTHYRTLAGFILYRLARLPVTGERIVLEHWLLEVVDMDGRRIDKLLLTER